MRETRANILLFWVLAVFLTSSPAASQTMEDYLILNDSYCTGSGGNSTGMGCSTGRSRNYAQERELKERLEKEAAEWSSANRYESDLLNWLADLEIDMPYNGDEVRFSFPESPSERWIRHFICLQNSLFSLYMAADYPDLYYRSANFYGWSPNLHIKAMTAYWHAGQLIWPAENVNLVESFQPIALENSHTREILNSLIRQQLEGSPQAMRIRLVDFAPRDDAGVYKQGSLLEQIGFSPLTTGYDSIFAKIHCEFAWALPRERVFSPQTDAFLQGLKRRKNFKIGDIFF